MSDQQLRAASDVGGTFTDLVSCEIDDAGVGRLHATKVSTTPPDFDTGVLTSLDQAGVELPALDFFAHGTTVVINALTERKGSKTALITTTGFRDVLEIARGNRPDLFNFNFRKPKPFVERRLRLEIDERTDYHGRLQLEADLSGLPEQVAYLQAEGVKAIAIVFLHSYHNPHNEQLVESEIRRLWPEVSVLASHQVSREWREYERTNTTVLAAYVHPVANAYIERLEKRLQADGFAGSPYMMQSNGGIATAATAKRNPIIMVESGPASGIYAAAHLGAEIGEKNVLALDIGGTTAKCALIDDGEVKVTTEYHIERTTKNPGYPIQTPVSEIVEIGNGGGSIAWIDVGGKLHVGPQSAGANPGPAAYGKGGKEPTTTDANLVLGRIDPELFVGGEIKPDWEAIDAAFAPLQDKLGMSREEVARGIVQIANANMVNALRLVSTNKGYDPRDFVLVAFGGGGAMHAVALAAEMRVRKIIVPVNSAVFSAWGMLLTDLRRDQIQTRLFDFVPENYEGILSTLDELRAQLTREYQEDGINIEERPIQFTCYGDMRYQGQEHTVKVPLLQEGEDGSKSAMEAVVAGFHDAHEKRYTYRLENPVQIVNFHVVATVTVERPALAARTHGSQTLIEARTGIRTVDFHPHGVFEAPVYDGGKMAAGTMVSGPCVIQEPAVTLPVFPGYQASVDHYGNYHVEASA